MAVEYMFVMTWRSGGTGAERIEASGLSPASEGTAAEGLTQVRPREVDRLLGIGLDTISGRSLQLARRHDSHPIPAAVRSQLNPNLVGPASYATATGPPAAGKDLVSSNEGVSLAWTTSPPTPSIAAVATYPACTWCPHSYAQQTPGSLSSVGWAEQVTPAR